MKKICEKYKLISNISCDGKKCIYGSDWFKVLGNSKVTLATESGSTVFDINNNILFEINSLLGETPYRKCPYSKPPIYSFEQISNMVNLKRNEVPNMGQISPKMFEAISLGTVLVMYEGEYYPGILKANIHYISLKKDYSNIEEVVSKIQDDVFLQNMADIAYKDIVDSGKYSYKSFIEMFNTEINNYDNIKFEYNENKNLELYGKTEFMNKQILINNIKEFSKL